MEDEDCNRLRLPSDSYEEGWLTPWTRKIKIDVVTKYGYWSKFWVLTSGRSKDELLIPLKYWSMQHCSLSLGRLNESSWCNHKDRVKTPHKTRIKAHLHYKTSCFNSNHSQKGAKERTTALKNKVVITVYEEASGRPSTDRRRPIARNTVHRCAGTTAEWCRWPTLSSSGSSMPSSSRSRQRGKWCQQSGRNGSTLTRINNIL